LDQEVDVDRESLIETFGDIAQTPVNPRNAGRKSGGRTEAQAIIQTFLRMVEERTVSLDPRGCQKAARKVQSEFPDYTVKHIASLIAPEYREQLKRKRS
jgi:hypothetical protein